MSKKYLEIVPDILSELKHYSGKIVNNNPRFYKRLIALIGFFIFVRLFFYPELKLLNQLVVESLFSAATAILNRLNGSGYYWVMDRMFDSKWVLYNIYDKPIFIISEPTFYWIGILFFVSAMFLSFQAHTARYYRYLFVGLLSTCFIYLSTCYFTAINNNLVWEAAVPFSSYTNNIIVIIYTLMHLFFYNRLFVKSSDNTINSPHLMQPVYSKTGDKRKY